MPALMCKSAAAWKLQEEKQQPLGLPRACRTARPLGQVLQWWRRPTAASGRSRQGGELGSVEKVAQKSCFNEPERTGFVEQREKVASPRCSPTFIATSTGDGLRSMIQKHHSSKSAAQRQLSCGLRVASNTCGVLRRAAGALQSKFAAHILGFQQIDDGRDEMSE
jgi:hypothetical protein